MRRRLSIRVAKDKALVRSPTARKRQQANDQDLPHGS